MDNPQYKVSDIKITSISTDSFKPYYKWITLNTLVLEYTMNMKDGSFKPYYKWITLNTMENIITCI